MLSKAERNQVNPPHYAENKSKKLKAKKNDVLRIWKKQRRSRFRGVSSEGERESTLRWEGEKDL